MSPRWEPNPDIRRGRSVVYTLHAHLVFTPKYRRKVFTDEILRRCEEIMREVCAKANVELREFNGETDHVHLLVHYPPQVKLSALVGSLKGVEGPRVLRTGGGR
jgi:putative transposase